MAKAIFIVRPESIYDDLPEVCYHFPKRYLRVAQETVNDWVIYYEPWRTNVDGTKRDGRLAYFATARVVSIEPDPHRSDHFYAYVSNYLQFDRAVPFKEGNYYYESNLRRADGKTNRGVSGQSVRKIKEQEYIDILRSGFSSLIADIRKQAELLPPEELEVHERPLIQQLVTRPFRKAAFSKQVKEAYNKTCAVTGIKLINGGGRPEVQAAHIQPVSQNGPDSVRNGIALSGTVHWMLDRGLISIDDDYSILIADGLVSDTIVKMIHPQIQLPEASTLYPHHRFLQYHRDNIFKG